MTTFPIGRPRFVTIEECLGWHEIALAQYGGMAGVRDVTLLESALAMPKQGFGGEFAHGYPFEMAAAYAFHVAKNHPFADGNKRAALLCCGSFLRMNGWDLISSGTDAADAIVEMVEGRMDKAAFASWLEAHSKPRPALELRDFFSALTAEHLTSAVISLLPAHVGATESGFLARATECAAAMPAIEGLGVQQRAADAAGDREGWTNVTMAVVTLLALHSLAEDMGYEW